ncbi:MAG: polysaccharide deacetylase family protein, partial [Verrucomicrobia bacterium]|nr:polysaccharide deacetylase family protein [Verrucomicrobiota bacterium]
MPLPIPWLAVGLAGVAACSVACAGATLDALGRTALFLYDGPVTNSMGLVAARQGGNLMGHFGFKAEVEPMAAYVPGSAGRYGAVFICGMTDGVRVPPALVEDVARRTGPTVWWHRHLEELLALTNIATRLGFTNVVTDDDVPFTAVRYRGITLPYTDEPDIDRVRILEPGKVQVLATAESGHESVPYVLRTGQFWYWAGPASSFSVESDVSLVFADLLHDILGVRHSEQRRALVRIEDVSANSDPADLRRVSDLLAARHIPFGIALIPRFRDPVNHIDQSLADEPDVVEAVHYMVAHGGTVVMHGVTHQLHGVSGDDYEFWDALTHRPTTDGAVNLLVPRLQQGLERCFEAGFYPVAFETPHYAASWEHYGSLATVFSHCYDRRLLSEADETQQYFPYPTTDLLGEGIIPENLGYVPEEKPDAQPIIDAARRLEAVRDPVASFFFHPFMPARYLEQILASLQADGYRFISLKEFSPQVALGDYAVSVGTRPMTVTPRRSFLKITTVDARGAATDQIRPVRPGRPVRISLHPPAGGLAAVQSVAHPPMADAGSGWWQGLVAEVLGRGFHALPGPGAHERRAVIAGSSPAFRSLLDAYGIPVAQFDPARGPAGDELLVVAHNARLDGPTRRRLAAWIEAGGHAVLEGHTPLAERLGFEFEGRTFTAKRLEDFLMPDVPITLAKVMEVERFTPPAVHVPLIQDAATEEPVAVAAGVGDGVVLYLATELDPDTGLGYTRYPFLMLHLRQRFGLESPVTSDGAEYYFDPGFRQKISLEKLVASWHAQGLRAIYAAAWNAYPTWTYDYDRLIRLCHAQGIAVYAWLELPEVSPKFWLEHPEWRDQTVTGRDADIGWRKFMNFANPACRAAALRAVDELLDQHAWDGVNVAELCFDTEDGLTKPDGYIPMNPDVRRDFKQEAGFDPIRLFDAGSPYYWKQNPGALGRWTRFRTGLTRDWLAEVLEHLNRRHLDVMVTALDSLSVPRVIEKNGCDSRDVVAMMDRYRFTLQVEDSEELWGQPPDRYARMGAVYRNLVSDPSRLMFDINVVKDRASGPAPTALPCGAELAIAAHAAALAGNGRVGIYSESSVLPEDRELLPFALAGGTRVDRSAGATTIVAARPVRFRYAAPVEPVSWWNVFHRHPASEARPLPVVDGRAWFCGAKGTVLLGPGSHRFTGLAAAGEGQRIWIKDMTAPVTALAGTPTGWTLDYGSARRAWLTVTRQPSAVRVDGQPLA